MSFNHEGTYTCKCGKSFSSSQAFNGHKSHCEIHLSSTGNLKQRQLIDKQRGPRVGTVLANKSKINKQLKLDTWLSEQHKCERCGKIMTEYYGSGRFCSEFCARSNPRSEETKAKIAKSLKNSAKFRPNIISEISRNNYLSNPKLCIVCGNMLTYEQRYRSTCSKACKLKRLSKTSSDAVFRNGGNLNPNPNKNCRQGTYRGIPCDSSWELAFLVYNLDHNIPIERNKQGFDYEFEGKSKKYYPDFIIDDTYIEIKNYSNCNVQAKINQFPKDKKLNILYWKDIKFYYNYCVNTYGKEFWTVLYTQ